MVRNKIVRNRKAQLNFILYAMLGLMGFIAIITVLYFGFSACEPYAIDEACFEQLRIQNSIAQMTPGKIGELHKPLSKACYPDEPIIISQPTPQDAEFEITQLMKRCWEKMGAHVGIRLDSFLPGTQCFTCFVFKVENLNEPIRKETLMSDLKSMVLPNGKTLYQYFNGEIPGFSGIVPMTVDIYNERYYSVVLTDQTRGWWIERVGGFLAENVVSEAVNIDISSRPEKEGYPMMYIENQNNAGECMSPGWGVRLDD